MTVPAKLLAVLVIFVAASEIGACIAVGELRPSGVLESAAPDAASGGAGGEGLLGKAYRPEHLHAEGIHPYLGYLVRNAPAWDPDDVMTLSQAELYRPGSPLIDGGPGDLIVGITGGSVSQQFAQLGGAEALGPLLADLPGREGRTPRFVMLGGGGVKQPQQLMGLQWLLVQGLRIDVLINIDGFNEVALHEIENELAGIAPIYPRNWRMRVSRLDMADVLGERAYLRRRRRELAGELLASPLRFSHLRQLVWIARDRSLRYSIRALEEVLGGYESEEAQDLVSQGPRQPSSTAESRRALMVDLWRESSLQLDRTCRANGIEYYHFLQPNQYFEGSKPLSEEEQRVAITDNLSYGTFVPAAYPMLQEAGDALAAQGVRFHDLTGAFADRPESIYVDSCCHVNRLGNQILAEAIAAAIASWGR